MSTSDGLPDINKHEITQQTVKCISRIMQYININIVQFHGIPWNLMELGRSSMEIHGIPWNFSRS